MAKTASQDSLIKAPYNAMKSLTDKTAILTFSSLMSRFAFILSGIIVVRWLTQEDLGTFRQAHLIINTCLILFLFGIPSSLYFFIPRAKDDEKRGIITHSFIMLFLIGSLCAALIYFFAPMISLRFNNSQLTPIIQRYSLYLAFGFPGACYFAAMICLDRVRFAALSKIAVTLAEIGAILVPLLLHCSLLTVFTVMLTVNAVVAVITIALTLQSSPQGPIKAKKGFAKEQIKYSLPLGITQMMSFLSREIDKIFISIFFSVKEFAIYSVGATELPITNLIAPSIRTVLLPEFSKKFQENKKGEILETWIESRRKLALITFPPIIFFYFISAELLTFVYSDRYINSVPIFQIYLLIPFIANFQSGVISLSAGKTNLLFYSSAANVLTNTSLNYLLIKLIGTKGPPLATAIALCISILILINFEKNILEVSWTEMFPFILYGKIMILSFLAGLPILVLRQAHVIPHKLLFLIASAVLFAIPVFYVYVKVLLNSDDRQIILRYMQKIPVIKGFL